MSKKLVFHDCFIKHNFQQKNWRIQLNDMCGIARAVMSEQFPGRQILRGVAKCESGVSNYHYIINKKKTRLPQSINQRRGISTKSVLGSKKTIKTIFSRARYLHFIFYFIFSRTLKSLWAQFSSRIDVYISGDELRSKFSQAPIQGREY